MPLLDSFKVDHTIMPAPAVRLAKVMHTPSQDKICVFDLRFCRPNMEILDEKGIHTLEHLFAGFMRDHLNNIGGKGIEIIDISPMGCRTGFYMSTIGEPFLEEVKLAWELSMNDVLKTKNEDDIPELNIYQCGTANMHSLKNAQEIAMNILNRGIGTMDNQKLLLDKFQ